jgi:FAD/FMN-containing dehydrogenase
MNSVQFNETTGQAKVGSGIRMLELSERLFSFGVTIPMATGPTVGLGGLCLGGGVGLTTRLLGLTCDSLVSVEMVTADGELIFANLDENPDLFWALRGGGGGNFGVVTSFLFDTHPISKVGLFSFTYPWEKFVVAVDGWQRWAPFADWGLTSLVSLRSDRLICIQGQYTGGPEGLERLESLLEPLTSLEPLWSDISIVSAMDAAVTTFGLNPDMPTWSRPVYGAGQLFKSASCVATNLVPLDGIYALKSGIETAPLLREAPSQPSMVQLLSGGGQASVPLTTDTAVFYRDALFIVQIDGYWTAADDREDTYQWVRNLRESLAAFTTGAYVNYVDSGLGEQWLEAYYGENAERLCEVKSRYDSTDFFHFRQSIPLAKRLD